MKNKIRKVKESLEEQQHQAVTTLKCVRTRHVEQMHGKDIRNSEELNSQKKKQSQMDERSATCEDGQGGDPELTTTIRKSVIINVGIQQERKKVTDLQLETSTEDLDNVHKEVMQDIKQLHDGLDITIGTNVFSNPE